MTNNHSIITDDYVAGVLAGEARDASLKYSTMGLEAYRPNDRPANKLKPNTRFLRHIIKETKNHNEALLAKEAAESQARLDELAAEEDRKRRKFKPDAKDMRKRQLGDITSILSGGNKRKRDEGESERRSRHEHDDKRIQSDPIPAPRIRGRGGQREGDGHGMFRSDDRRSRSPMPRRDRDERSRKDVGRADKRHRARSASDDDRRKRHRSHRDRSASPSTSEEEERRRRRRSYRDRSRSRSVSQDRDRRRHRSHKRRDRSRSRSPAERSRKHRRRSDDEDYRESKKSRSRRSEPSKSSRRRSSKERQITTPPKSQTAEHSDAYSSGDDTDPLEDLIGPAPPPVRPAVRVRGRGAVASSSDIDGRFSNNYDASLDGEPDATNKGSDDWEEELEAYRDRQRWKQQGANRLREAGFSDEQVKKWEKGGEKDAEDVTWSKKGEKREWDRGKMVVNGAFSVKAEWAQ